MFIFPWNITSMLVFFEPYMHLLWSLRHLSNMIRQHNSPRLYTDLRSFFNSNVYWIVLLPDTVIFPKAKKHSNGSTNIRNRPDKTGNFHLMFAWHWKWIDAFLFPIKPIWDLMWLFFSSIHLQFKEFLGTYNKLTEHCFMDCVKDFTTRDVKAEEVYILLIYYLNGLSNPKHYSL